MLPMLSAQYRFPFDSDELEVEPTDDQATVLLRALAHYCAAYGPDVTVTDIANDLLSSNAGSSNPMTRDECERIAAVFATGPACTCPPVTSQPEDCLNCKMHGPAAAAELEAQARSEQLAESAWLRHAENQPQDCPDWAR